MLAEILLKNSGNKKNVQDRTKKIGKLSPVQQLPPTPPSVPPSAKLSSTPQNKNLGILSPSPSPRVRPASIDSPRSIKNESLSPKIVHSNLSNVGIRKIEKDIQDNKRRCVNEDIRSRHIEEKNRSYLTKDKFGDLRQNLTEPTPEAKRENYNKNFSSPRHKKYNNICCRMLHPGFKTLNSEEEIYAKIATKF
ncbi:hypothetical protein BpHYR1_035010 [Brachionus plicatilis]|uniref:Uncharacterized protein n=1 Tax=Brachionus plicatilis TaxID=10195 RepID=A0A3M7SK38_BRAPC|nr:hypothetical protein BpHYR1_035010 [Brachionus plicatilis]